MRKIYKTKQILQTFALAICLGLSSIVSAQISGGTVTIDGASATSGNNYNNWADFRTALVGTTLTSALTVNVITNDSTIGTITLPAIAGASSTNTITVNGNGNTLRGNFTNEAVILLDGIDYLTIGKLVVMNTNATNPLGIRFQNASDFNTISGCTIQFNNITSGATNRGCYIAFTNSPTSFTSTTSSSMGINNTIDGNTLRTTNTNSPGLV